jgi:hypothetical protein
LDIKPANLLVCREGRSGREGGGKKRERARTLRLGPLRCIFWDEEEGNEGTRRGEGRRVNEGKGGGEGERGKKGEGEGKGRGGRGGI